MKFSETWLREWVNPEISTEQLAEQLSMAGLEVDGVEPVAGEFSGVVVGEVVDCGQHPDADKLRVTKVNVGGDVLLDIVCGAPNCRLGLKVAVATVGAILPGNFKIKKAKLRGQPSFGMLCSHSELGLSDESDGIMELPVDAPIGTDLRDYMQLNDNSIEVDLTPNRGDCLGMRGLAREVGVLNQADVQQSEVSPVAATIDEQREVRLLNPEDCPRYLGRVIRNVNLNAQSPLWMQEKLRRGGIRSIDPVVDVTNYILLELGHPMHAFDNHKLDGAVEVRLAKQGEKLTLLDGNEIEIQPNTLVIADEHKALALAGIFGGLHSGVAKGSTDIFLESAFFAPDAILGKARQYGLHTDASHRYERGVDPQLQRVAIERATQLLLEIVGGQAGPIFEAVSEQHLPQDKDVVLRQSRLKRVLGIEIEPEQVSEILARLGFGVKAEQNQWQVKVPAYRFDISIEEDLIEEVARVYGYNAIPEVSPMARLSMLSRPEQQVELNSFKQALINRDYQEAITYSFVDPKAQQALHPDMPGMALPHPISADMSVMRVSLFVGLLQAVSYNQKRQQGRVRLFETGLRFIPDNSEKTGVRQQPVVAGVIAGNRYSEHWDRSDDKVDFYDVKGDVEALLAQTAQGQIFTFKALQHTALHPGQSAGVYLAGELVGLLGAVHPKLEKPLGLQGKTFVFELELDKIHHKRLPTAGDISKFPANRRDIALVVKEQIAVSEILSYIENCGVNQLVGINLFDVYRGKGIEPGEKSLAISLILQDVTTTLAESEIQNMVNKIVDGLSKEFDAALRD